MQLCKKKKDDVPFKIILWLQDVIHKKNKNK